LKILCEEDILLDVFKFKNIIEEVI